MSASQKYRRKGTQGSSSFSKSMSVLMILFYTIRATFFIKGYRSSGTQNTCSSLNNGAYSNFQMICKSKTMGKIHLNSVFYSSTICKRDSLVLQQKYVLLKSQLSITLQQYIILKTEFLTCLIYNFSIVSFEIVCNTVTNVVFGCLSAIPVDTINVQHSFCL